jgi:hypothetical protein
VSAQGATSSWQVFLALMRTGFRQGASRIVALQQRHGSPRLAYAIATLSAIFLGLIVGGWMAVCAQVGAEAEHAQRGEIPVGSYLIRLGACAAEVELA